jgi:hypothetical protein
MVGNPPSIGEWDKTATKFELQLIVRELLKVKKDVCRMRLSILSSQRKR